MKEKRRRINGVRTNCNDVMKIGDKMWTMIRTKKKRLSVEQTPLQTATELDSLGYLNEVLSH